MNNSGPPTSSTEDDQEDERGEVQEVYEFPAAIEVKTIGKVPTRPTGEESTTDDGSDAQGGFQTYIKSLIEDELGQGRVLSQRRRPSRNNRYVSISTTVTFTSRAELNSVLTILSSNEQVLWVI